MANKRYFIGGLGLGIICGALLLQLMLIGERQAEVPLAPVSAETDGSGSGQSGAGELLASGNGTAEAEVQGGEDAAPSSEPDAASGSGAAPSSVTPAPSGENGSRSWNLIKIEAGMGLKETGELLAQQHIIEDASAFVKRMKSLGKPVRAGYFLFAGEADLDEAIGIVSSMPLSAGQAELIRKALEEAEGQAAK